MRISIIIIRRLLELKKNVGYIGYAILNIVIRTLDPYNN